MHLCSLIVDYEHGHEYLRIATMNTVSDIDNEHVYTSGASSSRSCSSVYDVRVPWLTASRFARLVPGHGYPWPRARGGVALGRTANMAARNALKTWSCWLVRRRDSLPSIPLARYRSVQSCASIPAAAARYRTSTVFTLSYNTFLRHGFIYVFMIWSRCTIDKENPYIHVLSRQLSYAFDHYWTV